MPSKPLARQHGSVVMMSSTAKARACQHKKRWEPPAICNWLPWFLTFHLHFPAVLFVFWGGGISGYPNIVGVNVIVRISFFFEGHNPSLSKCVGTLTEVFSFSTLLRGIKPSHNLTLGVFFLIDPRRARIDNETRIISKNNSTFWVFPLRVNPDWIPKESRCLSRLGEWLVMSGEEHIFLLRSEHITKWSEVGHDLRWNHMNYKRLLWKFHTLQRLKESGFGWLCQTLSLFDTVDSSKYNDLPLSDFSCCVSVQHLLHAAPEHHSKHHARDARLLSSFGLDACVDMYELRHLLLGRNIDKNMKSNTTRTSDTPQVSSGEFSS